MTLHMCHRRPAPYDVTHVSSPPPYDVAYVSAPPTIWRYTCVIAAHHMTLHMCHRRPPYDVTHVSSPPTIWRYTYVITAHHMTLHMSSPPTVERCICHRRPPYDVAYVIAARYMTRKEAPQHVAARSLMTQIACSLDRSSGAVCVKDEVDVLGSSSLTVLMVSVDVKQRWRSSHSRVPGDGRVWGCVRIDDARRPLLTYFLATFVHGHVAGRWAILILRKDSLGVRCRCTCKLLGLTDKYANCSGWLTSMQSTWLIYCVLRVCELRHRCPG